MVYPFTAGSSADVLGRLFASRLSELLGQPIIFENVGGAGGMTGSNRVAKAAPDGYQFVLGGTFMALNQTLYKKPLYNLKTDFAPVALIVEQPIVLIATQRFTRKQSVGVHSLCQGEPSKNAVWLGWSGFRTSPCLRAA
jgi:tripartite-type tricarboxylate transporter receptor subunit TctC